MKKAFLLLTLFGLLVFLVQCKHDPFLPATPGGGNTNTPNNPNNPNPDPGDPCDPNVVYFERDVMPILASNCNMSGCHGNGSHEDGVDLTSYEQVKKTGKVRPDDPEDSDLYEVLVEKDAEDRMPRGMAPLSAEKIAIIRKWIEQGAQNLTCDESNNCNTANMSYKNNVVPILQTYCLGCHTGTASGGVDLSNYPGVETVAKEGRLHGAIAHIQGYTPMPQGAQKLDECKINQIKSWIDAGAQNN